MTDCPTSPSHLLGTILIEKMMKTTRGEDLLILIQIDREKLVENEKVDNSLVASNHEIIEFVILRNGRRLNTNIKTMAIKKADFSQHIELSGKFQWEANLRIKGIQENWWFLKKNSKGTSTNYPNLRNK